MKDVKPSSGRRRLAASRLEMVMHDGLVALVERVVIKEEPRTGKHLNSGFGLWGKSCGNCSVLLAHCDLRCCVKDARNSDVDGGCDSRRVGVPGERGLEIWDRGSKARVLRLKARRPLQSCIRANATLDPPRRSTATLTLGRLTNETVNTGGTSRSELKRNDNWLPLVFNLQSHI